MPPGTWDENATHVLAEQERLSGEQGILRQHQDDLTKVLQNLLVSNGSQEKVLEAQNETLRRIEEAVRHVGHAVNGNGVPGLKQRVGDAERDVADIKKTLKEAADNRKWLSRLVIGWAVFQLLAGAGFVAVYFIRLK